MATVSQKIQEEIKAVVLLSLYFGSWVAVLVVLKTLILDEYHIKFHAFSLAVAATLILAKVVLVLEHVPLGSRSRSRAALTEVIVRTFFYGAGVFVVLLLEKALEARHEHGGFLPALAAVFQHPDMPHVVANTIWVVAALFGYNVLSVIRLHLGKGGLKRLFFSPMPFPEKDVRKP